MSFLSAIKARAVAVGLAPVVLAGALFNGARYTVAMLGDPRKALQIAFLTDQTANVAANGRMDETISARAGAAAAKGKRWGCILCRLLDAIQTNHCGNALANYLAGGEVTPPPGDTINKA